MLANNKKLSILFDISGIIDGIANNKGNGIFFASYNILLEMSKQENMDIKLYCSLDKFCIMEKALKLDKILTAIPRIDFREFLKIESLIIHFEKLKYENSENNGNKIVRVFIKTGLNFLKIIKAIILKFKHKQMEEFLKDIDVYFSPFGFIPKEIKQVKHITKFNLIHDIIPLVLKGYKKGLKRSHLGKLLRSINNKDYYFTNSEYTKQDFINYFPFVSEDHVITSYLSTGADYKEITDINLIEEIKLKYKIPSNCKYVFSLCTFEPRKNLIFAIRNFIEFITKNNIDNLIFVLAGYQVEDFMTKCNKEINDFGKYKDKILKLDYTVSEDISALYSGAEMFVYPSIYEGFGMPILEAMKCGCPVICSNVTSMPEIIGDCGIQINPKNDTDLINAFKKMYFDKDFREQCRKKGLERAKNFSWKKCVETILKTIRKVTSN